MQSDRAILVTGSSTGIGKESALQLEKLGFRVFAGVRKPEDGEALQQTASKRLTPVIIDVTDEESIAGAVAGVSEAVGGKLLGLVNNAGIAFGGPLEVVPMTDIRRIIEVNVIGVFAVTRACLPLLRQGGRIIMMGSASGRIALPGFSSYAASKFAIEALTDSLRVELRQCGIPVSVIEPGSVATPIWDKGLDVGEQLLNTISPEIRRYYSALIDFYLKTAKNPQGIPPEKVVKLVVHALTSPKPKNRYLIGRDALVMSLAAKLPDRLRDWVVMKAMSL